VGLFSEKFEAILFLLHFATAPFVVPTTGLILFHQVGFTNGEDKVIRYEGKNEKALALFGVPARVAAANAIMS
jgi:hypothetical protein